MMDRSVLRFLVACFIVLYSSGSANGSPLIYNYSMEGSGYWDSGKPNFRPSPSAVSTRWDLPQTTATDFKEEQIQHDLLTEMVDFMQENLFLILVITCLIVVLSLVLCSAAFLSRRLKVTSYYPCSFPAKMYVDQTDKTGGGRLFSEVPEKTSRSAEKDEPTYSAKNLQEDIILATRNLRTPTKTPWREEKQGKVSTDEEKTLPLETEGERKGISALPDETNPQQAITDKDEEMEIVSESSTRDGVSACHMEKSDPSSSDLPSESERPSGFADDSGAREDTDKQEADASATSFISEEKTAF